MFLHILIYTIIFRLWVDIVNSEKERYEMDTLEKLSVIILNYNSYEDTVSCVESILKIGYEMHIIIVDNVSTDESYNRLLDKFKETHNVTILTSEHNGGYSYGNNYGIRYAIQTFHSQYVSIMNPDVVITDPDIFQSMCTALAKHEQLAIVGASVLDAKHKYNPNYSGWDIPTAIELLRYHFLLNDRYNKRINWTKIEDNLARVECVAGCFFVAKSSVLRELGYLDENVFLYNEENILGIKCKIHGYIEGILLDKFYIHNHKFKRDKNETLRKKISATKNMYISTKYLCATYYSKKLLPILFFIEVMNKVYLLFAFFKNKLRKYFD